MGITYPLSRRFALPVCLTKKRTWERQSAFCKTQVAMTLILWHQHIFQEFVIRCARNRNKNVKTSNGLCIMTCVSSSHCERYKLAPVTALQAIVASRLLIALLRLVRLILPAFVCFLRLFERQTFLQRTAKCLFESFAACNKSFLDGPDRLDDDRRLMQALRTTLTKCVFRAA